MPEAAVQLMWHLTMQCNKALAAPSLSLIRGIVQLANKHLDQARFTRQIQSNTLSSNQPHAPEVISSSGTACLPETMDFPGGIVPFTSSLEFIGSHLTPSSPRIPCYRTLDGTGRHLPDASVPNDLDQQMATELYTAMAKLQVMDTICYDAQRQVR